MNDTDLDQTCNLNASYEIIPSRQENSQSPQIETYDFVENVIDCNQVEFDDDEKCENEDQNNIDNNKSIFLYQDDNCLNESKNENEEENLTVIIPEELNKIKIEDDKNETEEKIEKEQENIRTIDDNCENELKTDNQNSNTKIPNYFLPREDLEKTMKQLHYNYVNVRLV